MSDKVPARSFISPLGGHLWVEFISGGLWIDQCSSLKTRVGIQFNNFFHCHLTLWWSTFLLNDPIKGLRTTSGEQCWLVATKRSLFK